MKWAPRSVCFEYSERWIVWCPSKLKIPFTYLRQQVQLGIEVAGKGRRSNTSSAQPLHIVAINNCRNVPQCLPTPSNRNTMPGKLDALGEREKWLKEMDCTSNLYRVGLLPWQWFQRWTERERQREREYTLCIAAHTEYLNTLRSTFPLLPTQWALIVCGGGWRRGSLYEKCYFHGLFHSLRLCIPYGCEPIVGIPFTPFKVLYVQSREKFGIVCNE